MPQYLPQKAQKAQMMKERTESLSDFCAFCGSF
jgi:hypothetical protein